MRKSQKGKNVSGDMNQNCVVIKNTAMDEIRNCLEDGNISKALEFLDEQKKFIGVYHPYYPDFRIGIKNMNGKAVPFSEPLSSNAVSKMQPTISGKFKFSEKYSNFKSVREVFEHSYNTQTDIEIDLIEIKKMLGEKDDPYQDEIEQMLEDNGTWKIKHQDFPEAKPYKISLDDSSSLIEYVLLKTVKVEGTTIYFSNELQNDDISVQFSIDTSRHSMNFNFSVNKESEYDNKAQLKFLEIMNNLLDGRRLHVVSLENGKDIASGELDGVKYKSSFGSIENEIEFIRSLVAIESHFNTSICISDGISEEEYDDVIYLAKGITAGEVKGSWKNLTTVFEILDSNKEIWETMTSGTTRLAFEQQKCIEIFGHNFFIPKITLHLFEVRFKDVDTLKNKLEVLEKGDSIKVNLVPGDNDKYVEVFSFE